MSFPFHLPKEAGQTRRYDATGAQGWQTYSVPAGATMLHVVAASGGGAGGAGFGAAAGTARGGGGGGGSGALARITVPCSLLPGTLYLLVGLGGTAGPGSSTVVSVLPTAAFSTYIAATNGGSAGGSGTAATVGAAGAGGLGRRGGADP